MKITSSPYELNPYVSRLRHADKSASAADGAPAELSDRAATVEISLAARQLAASDIVNHAARYFGTAQIDDSLTRLLKDQPSEVQEAVYGIIQSNFITDVTDEQDRGALLELGLAQAQYIADNYMKDGDAAEFMDTIRMIGAISKTRTVDPVTKQIRYETPPQRPVGAPDDYVDLSDLMRRFEPETLNKLQEAVASGGDWSGILLGFAKKAAAHTDWVQQYRDEAAARVKEMLQNVGDSRFGKASTAGLAEFANDIRNLIANSGIANATLLNDNLEAFRRTLGSSNPVT